MRNAIFFLVLGLMGNIVHAGSLPCEANSTGQCQEDGTFDKFGNPIGPRVAGLDPCMTECLAAGGRDCLRQCHANFGVSVNSTGDTIYCRKGP